jgi:hypothetical protein
MAADVPGSPSHENAHVVILFARAFFGYAAAQQGAQAPAFLPLPVHMLG